MFLERETVFMKNLRLKKNKGPFLEAKSVN